MTCGSCGATNPADSRFCNTCGHPLITRPDERRVATVVFADLVGFTSLSETRDPERIKNLVDRCFARLALDITEFGGQVDKIMGDALIALFGAPTAHEDDAERAVRAALRMQQSLAEFQSTSDIRVKMRVGVNTGEVLVGALRAGGEYTAMGDVVNTAQRLQAGAEPGTVVVGPATWSATRECIDYESLGELRAKGREEPVSAWVARHALLPPGYRLRRRETPFVGRGPELGLLTHAVDAAVERHRAHLVLLIGEAGVGKTRLAEEAARIAKVNQRALVLEGRCVPYGEANVWWPIAEALRQACGITTDDPLPVADGRAIGAVALALGQPERSPEVKRVVNGLLFLMGYEVSLRDIDPLRAREEAMRSVLSFVEAAARERPVVLVLSDLHWADELVLGSIDALLDRLRGSRFVLVATARQELYDRWASPPGRHNTIVVNLDPLDRESSGYLLGSLLDGEIDAELRNALLDRAGGNPFFLEELVALLADAEGVPQDLAAADPGSLSGLPDTLRGLVSARIDSLSADERATLEDAAVWGRSGPVTALQTMGTQIHGIVDSASALDALADKEILGVGGQRWHFHSDLIREVAYATLTKSDRAQRHCGIADFLEVGQGSRQEASDRTVDVIAYHYGAAAELAAELGSISTVPADIVDRALDWIGEAAHRAEMSEALPVSIRLYSQALRLIPFDQPEKRVASLLGRAAAETDLRHLDAARVDIGDAIHLAGQVENVLLIARATLAKGEFEQKAGDLERSLDTVAQAIDQFRVIGDLKGMADSSRVLGMTHIFSGQHRQADDAISTALGLSRDLGDQRGEAWALQNLAWISYIEGRSDEAESRLNDSAAMFQELGDSGGLNWALGLLAFVRFHQGKLAEAEVLGAQILIEANARGDRWGEGMMLLLMSGVQLWSGRSTEAIDTAKRARTLFDGLDDGLGSAQARTAVGRSLVTSGAVAEGFAVLRETMDRHPAFGDEPEHLRELQGIGLAGAAVQVGEPELAIEALGGEFFGERAPETIGHGDGQIAGALALLQSGRVDDALGHLQTILDRSGTESPFAQSVLALALVAGGRTAEVPAAAQLVIESPRATYLDRANARLAHLLARAVTGDAGVVDEAEAFIEAIDRVDDPVSHAVIRLSVAAALATVGDPGAPAAEADAEDRLDRLGITARGWRRIFQLALDDSLVG